MKRIQIQRHGGPEVMELAEVERPTPAQDQILVKVRAASYNPVDGYVRSGNFGSNGATFPMGMGVDFAGTVAQLGSAVEGFREGDEVYGFVLIGAYGTFGEYTLSTPELTTIKPPNISFEAAATLPLVGATAYTALVIGGKLRAGMRVFINGAAGGVGQMALQFVRSYGATAVATSQERDMDMLKKLGAEEVYDYRSYDYSAQDGANDLLIDNSGKLPFEQVLKMLKPRGLFTDVLPKEIKHPQYSAVWTIPTRTMLAAVDELARRPDFSIHIGKRIPLKDAIATIKEIENGTRAAGKTVLVME